MFCEQNNPILWKPKPLEIKRLSEVNKHIDNLKDELTRWNNRLEKEYVDELVHAEILRKIKELKTEIKQFEKESKRIISSSEDLNEKYDRLTEIKGVGKVLATTILTEMPSVESFENAGQYAAFIGVTPSHKQSGTSVKGKSQISKKGNRYIRKTLYMAAIVTKNHNKHFEKWVRKLEKKGKLPKVIVVAIMRKLLYIIFGMLKNNTSFDPNLAFNHLGSR
jgi:transposase